MRFDVADKDISRLTEDNLPEYLASYLCWGALQAHLEQGEGKYHENTLKDTFQQFEARVLLWREFRYARAADSSGKMLTDPLASLTWLHDWDKRGRPDSDASVVRINGQAIQAEVSHPRHHQNSCSPRCQGWRKQRDEPLPQQPLHPQTNGTLMKSSEALNWLDGLTPTDEDWRDPDFVLVVSSIMLQGIPRRCGQMLIDAGFGRPYPQFEENDS